MTVWIVNPFDNLPTEGFRPQRYWLMAEAFARAGHRVVYWTSDFNHGMKEGRKRKKIGVENRCTAEGLSLDCEGDFEVVEIATRPYLKNVCWVRVVSHRQLARDFERMARERLSFSNASSASSTFLHGNLFQGDNASPDLIVASTPPLGLCDAARRVARACGAKFVCDIQDAWPETFARLLPRGFKWLGTFLFAPLRRTARRLYRTADLVTGVSARYAALSGRNDFHLAYHGIAEVCRRGVLAASGNRQAVFPQGDAARRRVHEGGRTIARLVYLGNLGAGYDLVTVIDAVARRADLTLDIAGRGPKEPALRALVARLNLDSRVRFHGYLDSDSLRNLLSTCDAGIIPMRDDSWVGLPYKLCDYLQSGLPVLTSLAGECGSLLERTATGCVYAPGDPESLLRALTSLPKGPVALPSELRAEDIYARYVEKASSLVPDSSRSCPASRVSCPRQDVSPLKLSVLVPSLDGSVPQSLRDQVTGCADVELVVVTGVSPVGKARNEGLRRATGEYVAWVDSDDEVAEGWLAEILAALADGPDVVTFDAELVGWKKGRDFTWGLTAADATIERLRADVYRDIRRPSALWLCVTRRELWNGISFDESVRVAEDYLILPQVLLKAGSCRYVPHRLYRYIRSPEGLSLTRTATQVGEQIGLWERRLAECPPKYRGPCAWGLAVSAYWTCCLQALFGRSVDAATCENAARCRALIRRYLPLLLREACSARTLSFRDRASWTVRFVSAALDCWTLQKIRHGRFGS